MVDLFADMPVKVAPPSVCFNTDSMFDLQVGNALRGHDGMWYINGGWGQAIAGVHSFGGMYKSTWSGSLLLRTTSLYQTQAVIGDSEDAISRDRERLIRMSGDHPIALEETTGKNQVVCLDCKVEYDIDGLFKFLRELGENKLKHRKEMTITTPFLDPATGKRISAWQPTPIFIDSLTEMHSNDELTQIEVGIDDKKTKTVYMIDANKKTLLLRWLSKMCMEYGFIACCTAHYGAELNLDSYGPTPKQLQYMKQGYKTKGVGSKFTFLTSPQCQIVSAKVLDDDKHEAWYKYGNTSPTDINEIGVQIQRCKNNVSGSVFTYIVSQSNGLLPDISDYHYLRTNKLFGMNGNPQNHQLQLYPDKNLSRNTVRQASDEDPKLRRALQLTAQLLYVQQHWNTDTIPFEVRVEPGALLDALNSDHNKLSMDRILNSRGYWLPDEIKCDQEYMSVFDILEFVDKCKLIPKKNTVIVAKK